MEIREITSELGNLSADNLAFQKTISTSTTKLTCSTMATSILFGAVELISFIESRFSVRLTNSDWAASPMNTIREISSFVAKRHKGEL